MYTSSGSEKSKYKEAALKGTTGSISVAGMLRLLCSYGKTGVLEVDGDKDKGSIELNGGEITNASIMSGSEKKLSPREAIIRLLLVMEAGSFSFEETKPSKSKSLDLCVEDLILESARLYLQRNKNLVEIKEYLPPENEVLKTAKMSPGKKISVTFFDDEWNMLIAFNGDANTGAILKETKIDGEKAQVIIYALISAGFLRRSRFKIPEISRIARGVMGNIGGAIVDSALHKLKIDTGRMGMRDFLGLLNELENSFAEITGRARAKEIIEKIWMETK
jgi:hypothetical protein